MKNSSAIFIQSMNVVSPLGMTAEENYVNLKSGEKGIRAINKSELSPDPVFASLIDKEKIENQSPEINLPGYSLFEKLIIRSVSQALTDADIAADDRRTLFVISTTKGNISALAQNHDHRDASAEANIFRSALRITQHFFNPNKPVVISHACISGVVALIYGRR
jgi:3-oxoacyl-[acyl-carrier-protein] synthase I